MLALLHGRNLLLSGRPLAHRGEGRQTFRLRLIRLRLIRLRLIDSAADRILVGSTPLSGGGSPGSCRESFLKADSIVSLLVS
jgi:hypothetical protein